LNQSLAWLYELVLATGKLRDGGWAGELITLLSQLRVFVTQGSKLLCSSCHRAALMQERSGREPRDHHDDGDEYGRAHEHATSPAL
jgi:hypothetical protein